MPKEPLYDPSQETKQETDFNTPLPELDIDIDISDQEIEKILKSKRAGKNRLVARNFSREHEMYKTFLSLGWDDIYYEVKDEKRAGIQRTRFYHARAQLKILYPEETNYNERLDRISISIGKNKDKFYVHLSYTEDLPYTSSPPE